MALGQCRILADRLDGAGQGVLRNQNPNAAVRHDKGDLGPGQTKIDRLGHQARLGDGPEYIDDFDAVMGQHRPSVAFLHPQPRKRFRQPAGPRVPASEGSAPFEVGDAKPSGPSRA